jgi:hypothetical protein
MVVQATADAANLAWELRVHLFFVDDLICRDRRRLDGVVARLRARVRARRHGRTWREGACPQIRWFGNSDWVVAVVVGREGKEKSGIDFWL